MSVGRRKSGIILLSVVWILAILSLLALSLGKSAQWQLSLVQNSIGRLKAYAAARAGVNYAVHLLGHSPSGQDTLYQCGIKLEPAQDPQQLFKGIKVGEDGYFDIVYTATGYGSEGHSRQVYGIQDEARRINVNVLNESSGVIFSRLLQQAGKSRPQADAITAAVVDWKGKEGQVDGYKHKNRPFDRVEELMQVQGMDKDIFLKIKDQVTVYPQAADGVPVNFDTSPDDVITAMVGNGTEREGLIRHRNGPDGIAFTPDDGQADGGGNTSGQPGVYYRTRVVGVDEPTGMRAAIEIVVERPASDQPVRFLSWERDRNGI